MTIRYTCPKCESVLKIRDEKAGTEGKCPKCRTPFLIPAPDSAEGGPSGEPPADALVDDVPVDDVDMPLELTPDVDESSTDFDPMDVLATSGTSPDHPAAPAPQAGNEKRPSVAELMREFEATRKTKEKKTSQAAARPARASAVATSGTAADALSRAYQQKRDKAAHPEPKQKEIDPDKQLMYEFIGKAAAGIAAALLIGYGIYAFISRESYEGPPLYDVSGVVTQDGQPLVGVQVQFRTAGVGGTTPQYQFNGMTDEEGRFELMYTADWYGATAGPHDVVIYQKSGVPFRMSENQTRVTVTEDGPNEFSFQL